MGRTVLSAKCTDFNILVFDEQGDGWIRLAATFPGFYTTDVTCQSDEPFEIVFLPPFPGEIHGGANASTYQIVITNKNGGPARHVKYVNINGLGVSDLHNASSIFGHAAARGGQAVAAMYYAIPKFPEDFSSRGPVTIYFDNKGWLRQAPEVREVPQITGVDGVDTTFFGFDVGRQWSAEFFRHQRLGAECRGRVAALVLQHEGGAGAMKPGGPVPTAPADGDTDAACHRPHDCRHARRFSACDREPGLDAMGALLPARRSAASLATIQSVTFDVSPTALDDVREPGTFPHREREGRLAS